MLRTYDDITGRLGGPLWWDDQGCPRYDDFTPDMCGVYDTEVAYLLIACQACGKQFHVAMSISSFDQALQMAEGRPRIEAPTPERMWHWHYGDPPPHGGCVGNTMNCETVAVLQYYSRDHDWERRPDHEFVVDDVAHQEQGT